MNSDNLSKICATNSPQAQEADMAKTLTSNDVLKAIFAAT